MQRSGAAIVSASANSRSRTNNNAGANNAIVSAKSANGVRRAARRMVQEQLTKRTLARRKEHLKVVEKDLVTAVRI